MQISGQSLSGDVNSYCSRRSQSLRAFCTAALKHPMARAGMAILNLTTYHHSGDVFRHERWGCESPLYLYLGQRDRHQPAHDLGLLQEIPRHLRVDQDWRADQQHHHVRSQVAGGRVTVTIARARCHRLGYRTQCALGLGHDDGRLGRHGAGPVVELAEPDHLVHHQQRDQQHEQSRHGIGGERVAGPPPVHRPVGALQDHEHARQQRDDDRGEPAQPA